MIMPSRNVRDQLAFATGTGKVVRVYRDDIEEGGVDAFVTGYADELVLLNVVTDSVQLDGFEVVFIDDITEVEMPHPREAFLTEALALRGMVARPDPPALELSTLPDLLESLAGLGVLATIYRELVDPDSCYVGIVRRCDERFVTITEISPDADYEAAPTRILLEEVTRVNFGTLYEDALEKVAAARGNKPPGLG